jgi:hypothetical protein
VNIDFRDTLLLAARGSGGSGGGALVEAGEDAGLAGAALTAHLDVVFGGTEARARFCSALAGAGACIAGGVVAGALSGAVAPSSDVDVWVPAAGGPAVFASLHRAGAFWKELPTVRGEGDKAVVSPAPAMRGEGAMAVALPAPVAGGDLPFWSLDRDFTDVCNACEQNAQYMMPDGRLVRWASSCTSFVSAARQRVDVIVLKPGKAPAAAVACFDLTCVQVAAWPQADGGWRLSGPGLAHARAAPPRAEWGAGALAELNGMPVDAAREWLRTLARGVKYAARGVSVEFEGWRAKFAGWRAEARGALAAPAPEALDTAKRAEAALLAVEAAMERDNVKGAGAFCARRAPRGG